MRLSFEVVGLIPSALQQDGIQVSRCRANVAANLNFADSSHPVVLQDTDYCFVFAIEPITFNTLHSNL